MARRKTRASGPSDESLRIARTITYYQTCLDSSVPHETARELWAHDMATPFAAGVHVSAAFARGLEAAAHREAAGRL
ncbi:hypothetical protein [Kitasatospora purpeofusca]|uniref:Uncharacterized protein n=1 Tax=Kitasatospora purpeofusca TaxID=67352 RepID=A0ABZ1TZ26_9ACTN|nr:hypothetical protein [Kitasatospora purpeofusca]